jgi:SAM-dependent methyltransferase
MFLRRRATQAEYFDRPERTSAELREHYAALNRINRLVRFDRPFRMWLPELLGETESRQVRALDLGAADGLLGRELTGWAAQRGWDWEFTNLDLCPVAAEMDPGPRHQVGSALQLPFPDDSFDVVLATTMTHHLGSDAEVITHFREAARVARRLVLLCDLYRSLPFMAGIWAFAGLVGESRELRHDAALSVRRGWRPQEWRQLANAAGLNQARVWKEHGTRVLLALRK